MSTRATYQLPGGYGDAQVNVTFYIHHDGYEHGAMSYFQSALERLPTSKGGMAEAFLRANDGAELTKNHKAHGDTEYRYTLRHDGVLAAEGRMLGSSAWCRLYHGGLRYWINSVAEREGAPFHWFSDDRPHRTLVRAWTPWRVINGRWWQEHTLMQAIDKAQAELDAYRAKFPTGLGNIAWHESEVKKLRESLVLYRKADEMFA